MENVTAFGVPHSCAHAHRHSLITYTEKGGKRLTHGKYIKSLLAGATQHLWKS